MKPVNIKQTFPATDPDRFAKAFHRGLDNAAPKVMAYPCTRGDADYGQGPLLTDTTSGISDQGERVPAQTIKWEGIEWRAAWQMRTRTLWVLAPTREMVIAHDAALMRLAQACVAYQGLPNVVAEVAKNGSARVRPETLTQLVPATDKQKALNQVTRAVELAMEHGATMDDIRLAVYGAMGLDSDDS